MYSRLRDGLLAPKAIVDYIKDKWFRPVLQLLLYSILLLVPTIISYATYDGLNYDDKQTIRAAFNGEDIPFKIVNGVLVKTGDKSTYSNVISSTIKVTISTDEVSADNAYYTIVFSNEDVYVQLAYIKIPVCNYNDYDDLKNFDLSSLGNLYNLDDWDIIFNIAGVEVKEYLNYVAPINCFVMLFENAFILLMLALIISFSFIMRFRNILKYSAMLKMSIYYTAPFVICYLISALFGIGILYYIGIILCIVYSFIGSSTIISRLMNQGRK